MPGSILVLTGPKNAGKSTFCRGLAAGAAAGGMDVAGICTEKGWSPVPTGEPGASPPNGALARPDRLVVTDLRSGRQALLAWWAGGRWALREDGLAFGREALAAATPCELLIIDEIGRFELGRGSGWNNALAVLARGRYGRAVVTVREGCFDAFRGALDREAGYGPRPSLHLYRLRPREAREAREELRRQVLSRLAEAPSRAVGR